MDATDRRLLDDFQRDFPLVPHPFAVLADRLGRDAADIRRRFVILKTAGTVSRIGAVFRPNRVGASTLAALAVAERDIERVADIVSAFPEVNHNYQREHDYNLWFVVAAPSAEGRQAVLDAIGAATGQVPLDLPMVEDFHIDLGFPLWHGATSPVRPHGRHQTGPSASPDADLSDDDRALIAALADGLPLSDRPYADLGRSIGMGEDGVLARLKRMIAAGLISRFGVIVRHHELGFSANAMVVWDIPDDEAGAIGRRLATSPDVTLCYRRRRARPVWPYNLFCMVHGRDRRLVEAAIGRLIEAHGLGRFAHHVLFSSRRFKQRGAVYGKVA